MHATLLAEDYVTPIEEVKIISDFHKCLTILRYDAVTEEWYEETVNALRIRRHTPSVS